MAKNQWIKSIKTKKIKKSGQKGLTVVYQYDIMAVPRKKGVFCEMAGRSFMHQLDSKNRMRMPAKLREVLGDGYYITVGTGGCLSVFTEEQMQVVKATLQKVNAFREDQQKVARFILYNTWQAEEDKQGRILIPENLRKYAKIEKNMIVVEGPQCVEIWSEESWNEYFKDINFNCLADALDALNK